MQNLTIATWNVSNNNYKFYENYFKVKTILDLLERKEIDIFALQEVNDNLALSIEEILKEEKFNYSLSRDLDFSKYNPFKVKKENNIILVKNKYNNISFMSANLPKEKNDKSKYNKTVTILPVIDNLVVFNTCLDEKYSLNKKQLKTIENKIDIISKLYESNNKKVDMIILGDLKQTPNRVNIEEFRENISNYNLKMLDISEKTRINEKKDEAVDYIIVPEEYELDNLSVMKDYTNYSAHYPVVASIKCK